MTVMLMISMMYVSDVRRADCISNADVVHDVDDINFLDDIDGVKRSQVLPL